MSEPVRLVRAETADGVRVGVRDGETLRPLPVATMAEVLRLRTHEVDDLVARVGEPVAITRLLPPLDGRGEVWCAGVTYSRSMDARMEESAEATVYDKVYAAERPELFAKAPAWRVVTDGEPVGIRSDSGHDVPEAELTLFCSAHGEIVGLGVCNDMSSRSIEGENPIYLPQAKIYAGGCALAPEVLLLSGSGLDPRDLPVTMTIDRGGERVFAGETSTAQLARTPEDLVDWLFRGQDYPDGVALATGTGIVPDLDFALRVGDRVAITVEGVGTLTNPVVEGVEPFRALARGERPNP